MCNSCNGKQQSNGAEVAVCCAAQKEMSYKHHTTLNVAFLCGLVVMTLLVGLSMSRVSKTSL